MCYFASIFILISTKCLFDWTGNRVVWDHLWRVLPPRLHRGSYPRDISYKWTGRECHLSMPERRWQKICCLNPACVATRWESRRSACSKKTRAACGFADGTYRLWPLPLHLISPALILVSQASWQIVMNEWLYIKCENFATRTLCVNRFPSGFFLEYF